MRAGRYGIETMVSSMKRGFCSFFGIDDAYELEGEINNSFILTNLIFFSNGSWLFSKIRSVKDI